MKNAARGAIARQQGGSQYIEVGEATVDVFGDTVFTRKGYAKAFPGLTVVRKYEGSGAATRCRWLIEVPDGFPFIIRRVTNPGGNRRQRTYDVLYAPGQEA